MGRVVRCKHRLRELYRHQTIAHIGSTYLIDNTKKRPSPAAPEIVFFFWPASITIRCTCIQILCPDDGGGPFGGVSLSPASPDLISPGHNVRCVGFFFSCLPTLKRVHLTLQCRTGEWRQIRLTLATELFFCLSLLTTWNFKSPWNIPLTSSVFATGRLGVKFEGGNNQLQWRACHWQVTGRVSLTCTLLLSAHGARLRSPFLRIPSISVAWLLISKSPGVPESIVLVRRLSVIAS